MAYQINWSLLGAPVNVGQAVQRGFETGVQRSAFATLANDPTNEGALSRLAMFDPQSAMQMRERARDEQFRTNMRSAFDVETGQIDPVAARSAYVEAGDVAGAMTFDRNRAQVAEAEREAADAQRERLARLADGATAENWPQTRAAAIELGIPPASIPEAYDEQWLQRQRTVLRAFADPNERTSFQRDLEAAGYDLSTPEGQEAARRFIENRYSAPPRIVTGPNGELLVVGGGGAPSGGGAPAPGTVEDGYRFRGGDPSNPENWEPVQGGASPSNGSQTFPQ